jgi:hypothetical protein
VRQLALAIALILPVVPVAAASQSKDQSVENCEPSLESMPSADDARARDLKLKVAYSRQDVAGDPPSVLWTLSVRNRTARAVRLTFNSSRYANVVMRRNGRVAYSWSRGRGVYDAITYKTLGPHEAYVCTLGPDSIEDLQPGRYRVIARLNTWWPRTFAPLRVEARRWFFVP